MTEGSTRIAALIAKHTNQELDSREEQELNQWLDASEENRALFQRFKDPAFITEKLRLIQGVDKEAEWEKVLKALAQEAPVRSVTPARIYLQRTMAAAAVVLLVSVSGWIWMKSRTTPTSPVPQAGTVSHDVAPGGSRALLTLSDGSTIVLDSTGKGRIAQQGNARIEKTRQGALAYTVLNEKPGVVLYNTLTTPPAGQYQLLLPDGTKVWLNNASALRYPTSFSGASREVELKGEAYFEVAKNAAQPFTVKVDQLAVEVLGTSLNIMAYPNEEQVRTTLLTGSVRVRQGVATALLRPGEQARLQPSGELKVADGVDTDGVVAWKNGHFNFDKADIRAVMRQLARWYDLEVRYEGAVSDHVYGGKIGRNLKLSEVLEVLKTNNIHFRVEGRTLTVVP